MLQRNILAGVGAVIASSVVIWINSESYPPFFVEILQAFKSEICGG